MSVWQLGVVAFFLRERLRAYRLGKAIAITSDAVFNFAELLRGFRPQQKALRSSPRGDQLSTTDVISRIVADHMARTLGQAIVIKNMFGAGGTTACRHVPIDEHGTPPHNAGGTARRTTG
jgi:hypothetical protein